MPFSAGRNQAGGILDPSQTSLSLGQRRTMDRLIGQGIDAWVARQLAIALTKTALSKADGHVPPQGVRAACRRGLDLAGEYGGPGLTEGAKERARSMAAGEAQTDEQLARIRSFTARHDSYEKKADPPSPGYVSWLLWGGDAGASWASGQRDTTEKSAIGIAKSALARVRVAKQGYHEAFSAACKEILPQGVVDRLHVRARAIAGGHGRAAARAAAQANSTDVTKADWSEGDHPRAPNGEFGEGGGADSNPSHAERAMQHAKDALAHIDRAEAALKSGDREGFRQAMAESKKSSAASKKATAASEKETAKQTKELTARLGSMRAAAQASGAKVRAANARIDRQDAALMAKSDRPAMGAAFAHARASGKDQSHEARKRRAQRWLKDNGHKGIGEDVQKMAPLPADVRAEKFLKLARERRKKREAEQAPVEKAQQVDLTVPTTIVKAEETQWQKLLWSVVYEPDVFDSHGDRMDAATIQKAAHEAFRQGMYVNHEHQGPPIGAHIVESFTAPVDFSIDDSEGAHVIRKGTWVVGTQVTDDAIWDKVLKGEYGGVSLEGTAFARTLEAEAA